MKETIRPQNNTRKKFDRLTSPLQEFLKVEASGGIVLFFAALAALVLANLAATSSWYTQFINTSFTLQIGDFSLNKSLLLLVNDGLMAIFFFVIGLEIKQEILKGELSSLKKAALPIFAALGGMILPALIYLSFNFGAPSASGWGIPMATDIAFALGVLSLFGKRVPLALKVFLLALAIIDDLGAILVIALFYTKSISMGFLALGFAVLGLLVLLNHLGFRNKGFGILFGTLVWFSFLKSGVHATIAGVLLAFATPAFGYTREGLIDRSKTLINDLIHSLHPWVSFLIMPIFAFFNAGIFMGETDLGTALLSATSMGVILGLLIGKPLGILGFSLLATKLGWADLPKGVSWTQIAGVGFLAGIGFTMALFINSLAFDSAELMNYSKLGIMVASLISGLGGTALLAISLSRSQKVKIGAVQGLTEPS